MRKLSVIVLCGLLSAAQFVPASTSVAPARPYAIVVDQKSTTTGGGDCATGWQTRALNTVQFDPGSIVVSVSANAVTLNAGTYRFRATAPAYGSGRHRVRLYNQTDSAVIATGPSNYVPNVVVYGEVRGSFSITATKAIRIEQYTETATANGFGFGVPANDGAPEVYAALEIWRQ